MPITKVIRFGSLDELEDPWELIVPFRDDNVGYLYVLLVS